LANLYLPTSVFGKRRKGEGGEWIGGKEKKKKGLPKYLLFFRLPMTKGEWERGKEKGPREKEGDNEARRVSADHLMSWLVPRASVARRNRKKKKGQKSPSFFTPYPFQRLRRRRERKRFGRQGGGKRTAIVSFQSLHFLDNGRKGRGKGGGGREANRRDLLFLFTFPSIERRREEEKRRSFHAKGKGKRDEAAKNSNIILYYLHSEESRRIEREREERNSAWKRIRRRSESLSAFS